VKEFWTCNTLENIISVTCDNGIVSETRAS